MTSKFKFWLPSIAYMALIFFISLSPAPESAKAVPLIGPFKIVHFVEYGILSFLYFFALHKTTNMPLFKKLILSVVFTYLYGITDELHQSFNPARTASVADTFTNFFGAVGMQSGIFSAFKINKLSTRKS